MKEKHSWIYDLLFILVLLLAGYLRLSGADWGEGMHQHPDELFMTGVLSNLRAHTCRDPFIPVDACPPDLQRWMNPLDYFNSALSTLNPYNRGNASYVYGDLPLTIVRAAVELTNNGDIGNIKFFARQFSALADLLTIFLLYLIVSSLYDRRIALFAAAFSGFAVMQIQQSHFFTVDLFTNLFMFLTLFFAVEIINHRGAGTGDREDPPAPKPLIRDPLFWLSIGFGIALGMAMASKINAAVLAVMLPGAFLVRHLLYDRNKKLQPEHWSLITLFLIAGGLAALVSFRIFQPYAFDGLGLSPQWVENINGQRLQATGTADLPWNLQWARRTHLYSFTNLTVWGLGLPLGILAWFGFLLMGWRILKGEWRHLLLWGWTAIYFGWQSLQFNPTMRYQLPVYPLLCMMASWGIFELAGLKFGRFKRFNPPAVLAGLAGVTVLVLTAGWAFAFQSIYLRDEPRMAASRWIYENVPGPINLQLKTADGGTTIQPLTFPTGGYIEKGVPYKTVIIPKLDGSLSAVTLAHATDFSPTPATVVLTLAAVDDPGRLIAGASARVDASSVKDPRGPEVSFVFATPLPVSANTPYILKIETFGAQKLLLSGASFSNETTYDWSLPFRVEGYDPFGGMYRGDLTMQVYWDDNADKLDRFMDTLNQSDYIFIPTNHQYAQITRVPERYPLTTEYYRSLIGCPAGMDIIECYRVARPGQFKGRLGFDLVAVFESYPTLGPWTINDQPAEEAFTFYDHPKVLIFQKTKDFSSARVQSVLGAVDLAHAVHLLPKEVTAFKDLMLPDARLIRQRAGGTWSQLFNYDWVQNKYPLVTVLVWYLFILILGLSAYPIARLALPGLGAYAYPLGRITGLALLAWISWMGGSVGVPYTRVTISAALALIAAAGIGIWYFRRQQFKAEWNSQRRFFVMVEIIFLAFFLIDLLIRLGNPDLWHPSKGGERPMDFSYFNAVLKSSSFPPYDPWFAGGYINYYYYGFVLAGTPVKLLGIVPSISYNLILPTWFALIAVGAFGVGYSLVKDREDGLPALVSGLAASCMTLLIGNLGTVRLIFNKFQQMGAPQGVIPFDADILQKWILAAKGLAAAFSGMLLPIGRGDWYWFPSRVIPAPGDIEPITEFPLFTFLYSDMHAHMLVMPVTLFIIAWAVSFIKARADMSRAEWAAAFGVGALMVGALKPTNTWDLYTYFPLAAIAVSYTLYRNFDLRPLLEKLAAWKLPGLKDSPPLRAGIALGAAAFLYILGSALYFPFSHWYGQAYGAVNAWTGSHTPVSSYLTQWGLFLFVITAWLAWETRQWMASTPVSALNRLADYSLLIEFGLAAIVFLLVYFTVEGIRIGWLALPIAAWAGILLLRPDMPDVKRAVLLMTGTALVLTIAVEVVVLVGDIGRMNTVFKLYLQAWMLLAVSAAASFGWLLNVIPFWRLRWRTVFQTGIYVLFMGVSLFTITATTDKVSDRMTPSAPHTLDSMTYMDYSRHWDGNLMELSQDYDAIRWLQENVQGSPVIVEANCTEYRWCSRMTIYTGLPGVLGWNWHQRQQRGFTSPNLIENRVAEIGIFYSTTDMEWARTFLKKYQVKYIIVGQLERNVYPILEGSPDGLAKFTQFNGKYWKAVHHEKDTTIYEVLP